MPDRAPAGSVVLRHLTPLAVLLLLVGACGAPTMPGSDEGTTTPTTIATALDGPVGEMTPARLDPLLLERLRAAALADRSEVADRFAFSRLVVVAGETFFEVNLQGADPAERRVELDARCGESCALSVAELLNVALSAAERAVVVNLPPPLEGFASWPILTFGDGANGARWRMSFHPEQLGLAAVEYFGPLPPRP